MKNEHTKGEWAWQKFGNQYMLTAQHGMREIIIGTVKDETNSIVHAVATNIDGRLQPITPDNPNAKLIAAAPEMLIALQAVGEWKTSNEYSSEQIWELVESAIKKATS